MPPKPKGISTQTQKPTDLKTVTKTMRLHKVQYDFHHSDALYRGFVGGIGCTAPETLLGGVPIGDLTSSAGECQTLLGASPRSPSFCKGKADLYRVTMESGRTVLVTLAHRFLTPEGWLPLSRLRVGSLLAADGSEDAIRDLEIPTDLKGDYWRGLRRDGVQLHPIQAFYLDKIRQSFGRTSGNHSTRPGTCRPSIDYSLIQKHSQALSSGESYHAGSSFGVSLLDQHHISDQGQWLTYLHCIGEQCHPLEADGQENAFLYQHKYQSDEGFWRLGFGAYQVFQQDDADFAHIDMQSQLFPKLSCFSQMPDKTVSKERLEELNQSTLGLLLRICLPPYTNSFWDRVQDITFARHGDFYDLTVPELEHYSAAGLWHHNSGKSYVGAYDLLRRAMSEKGRNRLYMVISPTYTILQDATMRTIYQLADELGVTKEKWKQPPRLVLNNGSEIIFRSGDDPDKLRGPNLSGIWMDEASYMNEEVFNIAIGRLREGGDMGFLTATFTPKGMANWTYNVFGKGDRENTAIFKSKTSQNPFLAGEFVGAISKQYSDKQASQELDGEFVDSDGAEWPNSHFGEHIWVDDFPKNEHITISTLSIDPSKGKDARHGDYSAIVKLARDRSNVLYCDAVMLKMDSEQIISRFAKEATDFEPDALVVETNQFQHLLAKQIMVECESRGTDIPIIQLYNTINKDVRIRRIGPYLANRNIRFRRSEGSRLLVAQLREFPLGKFDDGPDSLEMALRAMIGIWNNRKSGRVARRLMA